MRLCIHVLNMENGQTIEIRKGQLEVRCQVGLACGCPVCAGGRFRSSSFRVKAWLLRRDTIVSEKALEFTGGAGEFSGTFHILEQGEYKLYIEALDKENGATGRAELKFKVSFG